MAVFLKVVHYISEYTVWNVNIFVSGFYKLIWNLRLFHEYFKKSFKSSHGLKVPVLAQSVFEVLMVSIFKIYSWKEIQTQSHFKGQTWLKHKSVPRNGKVQGKWKWNWLSKLYLLRVYLHKKEFLRSRWCAFQLPSALLCWFFCLMIDFQLCKLHGID
jgi:hypothetical protein